MWAQSCARQSSEDFWSPLRRPGAHWPMRGRGRKNVARSNGGAAQSRMISCCSQGGLPGGHGVGLKRSRRGHYEDPARVEVWAWKGVWGSHSQSFTSCQTHWIKLCPWSPSADSCGGISFPGGSVHAVLSRLLMLLWFGVSSPCPTW